MQSVSAIGKIATRIRQAYFDPNNIESILYAGQNVTLSFSRTIQAATWCQIAWNCICGSFNGDNCYLFPINGLAKGPNRMDYLCAFALKSTFPKVKLAGTKAPEAYKYSFSPLVNGCACEDFVNENCANQLYYHFSDGCCGYPDDSLYIGSAAALQLAGFTPVHRLDKLYSKHKVSWGKNAVLANIEEAAFQIDFQDFERKSRHAIFNDLQYKMREDVFPKAGEWATSLPACEVEALHHGCGKHAELLPCEEDRTRTFILPFSFTTSALADRGEEGKFKSAYPVMMTCVNNVDVEVRTICDIKDLLYLQEEILRDFGCSKVAFVALADSSELNVNGQGVPQNPLTFSNGCNFWNITADQFHPVGASVSPAVYMTGTTLTFTIGDCGPITKTGITVKDLRLGNLASTGRYKALTRQGKVDCQGRCADNICWADWVCEDDLRVKLDGRALGASCTDFERGMMKVDWRTKKWLFEKYTRLDSIIDVCPGNNAIFNLDNISGQFKYAYLYAENVDSLLQGQVFNYTNDTDCCVVRDSYSGNFLYRFDGRNAIAGFNVKMQDEADVKSRSDEWLTTDTALFAQRLPREVCAVIAPRYSDFINSIQPGGSVNMQAIGKSTVSIETARSGEVGDYGRHDFGCKNTFGYNVGITAVSWNLAIFRPPCSR